jgi:hypothetical protein
MVKQYPHTLRITKAAADSTRDLQGDWIPGSSSTSDIACRAEPNKTNGLVSTSDGTMVGYDWNVYMPLPQTEIAPGTNIEILNGTASLGSGIVKRFSAGQLNARLWV